MESLFPTAGQGPALRCSPVGCALICVVLLALFYFLLVKDKFAPAKAGYSGIRTGAGLVYQTGSQAGVGSESFSGGPEAPAFWGASGSQELDDYNSANVRVGESVSALLASQVGNAYVDTTGNSAYLKPAGMVGRGRLSDSHLASKLGGN